MILPIRIAILSCLASASFAQANGISLAPAHSDSKADANHTLGSMGPEPAMLSPDAAQSHSSVTPLLKRLSECPLPPARQHSISDAVSRHQYSQAETELVDEINKNPSSTELLSVAAGVFFLDGQFLNAAIALKKADHIRRLSTPDRFTLCLAYVALHRGEWARPEFEKLIRENPDNPQFLYWLARVDYDVRRYPDAIERLKAAVALDPKFAKAYDNLGLSLEANGDLDEAFKNYERAAQLNRLESHRSPWPPLNLGALLLRFERYSEAEANLREALQYTPELAQAHFRLGLVYDKQGKEKEAIEQLRKATTLDRAYADPLYALGRIYYRRGDEVRAQESFGAFRKLKTDANSNSK